MAEEVSWSDSSEGLAGPADVIAGDVPLEVGIVVARLLVACWQVEGYSVGTRRGQVGHLGMERFTNSPAQ